MSPKSQRFSPQEIELMAIVGGPDIEKTIQEWELVLIENGINAYLATMNEIVTDETTEKQIN